MYIISMLLLFFVFLHVSLIGFVLCLYFLCVGRCVWVYLSVSHTRMCLCFVCVQRLLWMGVCKSVCKRFVAGTYCICEEHLDTMRRQRQPKLELRTFLCDSLFGSNKQWEREGQRGMDVGWPLACDYLFQFCKVFVCVMAFPNIPTHRNGIYDCVCRANSCENFSVTRRK